MTDFFYSGIRYLVVYNSDYLIWGKALCPYCLFSVVLIEFYFPYKKKIVNHNHFFDTNTF